MATSIAALIRDLDRLRAARAAADHVVLTPLVRAARVDSLLAHADHMGPRDQAAWARAVRVRQLLDVAAHRKQFGALA